MHFTCNVVNSEQDAHSFSTDGQARTHSRALHPEKMLSNNSPDQAAFQSPAHGEGMELSKQPASAIKRAPTRMERACSVYEQGLEKWLETQKSASEGLFHWYCKKLDSDLERIFLAAAWFSDGGMGGPGFAGPACTVETSLLIQPQHPVGPYIIDFAFTFRAKEVFGGQTAVRVAVECDGAYFHDRTSKQVERDRARDRYLNLAGWRVMRFSESEIMKDARGCVGQVETLITNLIQDQIDIDMGVDEAGQ